jgi:hypothetical protein
MKQRNRKMPPWQPLAWIVLSLMSCTTCWGCVVAPGLQDFAIWCYADRYLPAELEVVKYYPPARRSGPAAKGIIHPGGEEVVSSIATLDLHEFVDANDKTGRRTLRPEKIEGKRLAVMYWPKHADEIESWHPPTIVRPGATDNLGVPLLIKSLIAILLLGVTVLGVRRCYRYARVAAPPDTREKLTPTWVGVLMIIVYLGVLGLVAYLSW